MSKKTVTVLLVLFVVIAGAAVGAIFFLNRNAPVIPSATPLSQSTKIVGTDV